ncbi:hypothetical protein D9758_011102 [Tetrapyrgos nigripes]|uniref:beta-galactosidase n=1 Tax=Tetrapyrgos nigripes TaxID=182062 RepID=A0A8H5CSG9_9AGAR|nr:hypothetical protein D9758_011102 [Tetrapyrgos nigripes]
MWPLSLSLWCLCALSLVQVHAFAYTLLDSPLFQRDHPLINNTGLTDQVGWDKYSFFIRGKRVFIQSGEFHGFRLPSQTLWTDIMQKAKAAGLNTISIYSHWGLINPKAGELDFEGPNALQPLFDAAKEAGLFIIARPGPYINSETTAGGIPGHVLTLPGDTPWNLYNGILRSNQTNYHDAWQDYINAIVSTIADNQITKGGPVIMLQLDNEYYNGPGQNEYIEQLKDAARRLGIVVPTSHNDAGLFQNLLDIPDIYGFDAYPLTLSGCTTPEVWRDLPTNWRSYHEQVTPEIPLLIPEYQGGAFQHRGGQTNEMCRKLTNTNSQRVLNHAMWASGSTGMDFYMFFGGTNWGQIPYPEADTSYEWAAAMFESRELSEKYYELKLQSMFLRSFPDLRMTDLIEEDCTTVPGVTLTFLKNPDTGAEFHFARHTTIGSWDIIKFTREIAGVEVPHLLPGRDSIITTANIPCGGRCKLAYSTASLFSHLTVDGKDVLVAYAFNDTTYEMAFGFNSEPQVKISGANHPEMHFDQKRKHLVISFTEAPGLTAITMTSDGADTILLLADYPTATRLWMPSIAGTGSDHPEYVDISATTPFLVSGPYLVRNATVDGETLSLWGDLNNDTDITLLAPQDVRNVNWNGQALTLSTPTEWGALTASLTGPRATVDLPNLGSLDWRFADSLPEISASFVNSSMTPANHTYTTSKFPSYYGKPWILYADDYGYHAGNLVWRGSFEHGDNMTAPTAVNVSISGGAHFAASVWLNEHYLGPSFIPNSPTNNESFPVSEDMLVDGTNHVTVLQDHMGHNLAGEIVCCTPGGRQRDLQSPKGLQGYFLVGRDEAEQFTGWKVVGNLGGEDFPDKTRKILNEGGLFGERAGWHLPGFDHTQWEKRTPMEGLTKPGVGFFRATFSLNIPDGFDVPLKFVFSSDQGHYRAQLYINGWMMGKRIANLGPQTAFVVQEGILNYRGENTIAVSLWALEDQPEDLRIPSLELVMSGIYSGGVGHASVHSPTWQDLRGSK